MHNDVLKEFRGVAFPKDAGGGATAAPMWHRLLDTDLGDPTQGDCRTLKSVLEERVITPFANSVDNPSLGAAYSAILFGPPGTVQPACCSPGQYTCAFSSLILSVVIFNHNRDRQDHHLRSLGAEDGMELRRGRHRSVLSRWTGQHGGQDTLRVFAFNGPDRMHHPL